MRITDEAFPYLALQQGALDGLKTDRAAWSSAYSAKMARLFVNLEPHLPIRCARVLDVGSGLGGIDALISAHYQPRPAVFLLDGRDDPPILTRHAQTFSNLRVARDFLQANGVNNVQGLGPPPMGDTSLQQAVAAQVGPFDLIVSFGSWCFHFPPAAYLALVLACCRPRTRLILEVRKGRPDYDEQLAEGLRLVEVIGESEKFERRLYVPR